MAQTTHKTIVKAGVMLGLLAGLVWLYCSQPRPHVITNYEVKIKSDDILPGSINVVEGHEVIWTNEDTVYHTVQSGTADDPSDLFTVGPIEPGNSASLRFDSVGVYLYHFVTRPEQAGIVNVIKDTIVTKNRQF